MKWWIKALIISAMWIVLDIVVGIIHTEIILKDIITPEMDEIISEHYGKLCVYGLVFIWVFSSFILKKETMKKYLVSGIILILWGIGIVIYGMMTGSLVRFPGFIFGAGLIVTGIVSVIKWHKMKDGHGATNPVKGSEPSQGVRS